MEDLSPTPPDPQLSLTPTSQVPGTPDSLAPAAPRGDNSQALTAPGALVQHHPTVATSGGDIHPPANFTGTWVTSKKGRPAS